MRQLLEIRWSAYRRIAVSFRALPLEASPSPVYGAALLMRFGFTAHPGFKSPSLRSLSSGFVRECISAGAAALCV